MPRERDDAAQLRDMYQHARLAMRLVGTLTAEEFAADDRTRLAVERCVEIIGEAARHLSPAFTSKYPEVPWTKIQRQRHRLAHEYGGIDAVLIHAVVKKHLPELEASLLKIAPNLSKETE